MSGHPREKWLQAELERKSALIRMLNDRIEVQERQIAELERVIARIAQRPAAARGASA